MEDTDIVRNMHNKNEEKNQKKEDKKKQFFEQEQQPKQLIKSFNGLHLSRPLLKAVSELGFINPTPIQVYGYSLLRWLE